jgi:hypothetical protein
MVRCLLLYIGIKETICCFFKKDNPDMKKSNRAQAKDRREVLGIIIPNAWDAEGRTTAWAISTYNENLYQIDMRNKIGKQLPEIAGKKVKAHGFIAGASGSAAIMKITDYIIIEDVDFSG